MTEESYMTSCNREETDLVEKLSLKLSSTRACHRHLWSFLTTTNDDLYQSHKHNRLSILEVLSYSIASINMTLSTAFRQEKCIKFLSPRDDWVNAKRVVRPYMIKERWNSSSIHGSLCDVSLQHSQGSNIPQFWCLIVRASDKVWAICWFSHRCNNFLVACIRIAFLQTLAGLQAMQETNWDEAEMSRNCNKRKYWGLNLQDLKWLILCFQH